MKKRFGNTFRHSGRWAIVALAVLLTGSVLVAQSPDKMSYQAVVRDVSNNLVVNKPVGMRISIIQGSVSGSEVYREIYNPNPQTNANGLVTAEIGTGIPLVGTFNAIDWSNGPYFVKTETDPNGGTNYTITGISQLLSVPYALHAKKAATADYNALSNLPELKNADWNTAYNWGNHATQGYLKTETDPLFTAHPASGVTSGGITHWNTAYTWGNHATQGYLAAETDPLFTVHPASGVTSGGITHWNTAYTWGNHATQGYLAAETDPLFTVHPASGVTSGGITNWNTAYTWGNHATQGYLAAETDPLFTAHPASGVTSGGITNWNTAYTWGNHATQNYLTGNQGITLTGDVTGTGTTSIPALIANNAVTTAKIADNAVSSPKILNNSITTEKIFNNAVTDVKISANAVTEAKLAHNAVTTPKIANNAVTVEKLPAGAAADRYLRGDGTWVTIPTGEFLPLGTSGQTLRHDGSKWMANSNLFHDGINVGIGTSSPKELLNIYGGRGSAWAVFQNNSSSNVAERGLYIGLRGDGESYLYSHEAKGMHLGTNNFTRMTITSAGLVGVGESNPRSRLHVNGTIFVTNNINNSPTGGANMLPVAYGRVSSTGAVHADASTENFTCTRSSVGRYEITIEGHNYNVNSYTTLASHIGGIAGFTTHGSFSEKLVVFTFNSSGTLTDRHFTFMVYKP